MNSIAKALGTVKYEEETWEQLFARVDKQGGIDNKVIIAVIVEILKELENDKENRGNDLRGTNERVRRETGKTKEEIPSVSRYTEVRRT